MQGISKDALWAYWNTNQFDEAALTGRLCSDKVSDYLIPSEAFERKTTGWVPTVLFESQGRYVVPLWECLSPSETASKYFAPPALQQLTNALFLGEGPLSQLGSEALESLDGSDAERLEGLYGTDWESRLEKAGYQRSSHCLWMPSLLRPESAQSLPQGPMADQFLNLAVQPPKIPLSLTQDLNDVLGVAEPVRHAELLQSLPLLSKMSVGTFCALDAARNTSRAPLLQNWYANTLVHAALQEKAPPRMSVSIPKGQAKRFDDCLKSRKRPEGLAELLEKGKALVGNVATVDDLKIAAHAKLRYVVQSLKGFRDESQEILALRERLDVLYKEIGGLDAQWAQLQEQDANLELQYNRLARASAQWAQKAQTTFSDKVRRWLPFARKGNRDQIFEFYQEHLQGAIKWQEDAFNDGQALLDALHTAMRRVKAERTKLQNQWLPVTDSLSKRSRAEKAFVDRYTQYLPLKVQEDPTALFVMNKDRPVRLYLTALDIFAKRCYELAVLYYEASHWLNPAEVPVQGLVQHDDTLSGDPTIHTLFVFDAESRQPLELLDYMDKADRVVFVGDSTQVSRSYYPRAWDEQYWSTRSEVDVEAEDFELSTFLYSQSNPFAYLMQRSAQVSVQSLASTDQVQALIDFSLSFSPKLKRQGTRAPNDTPLELIPVQGSAEQTVQGYVNHREAMAVSDWVEEQSGLIQQLYPNQPLFSTIVIYTPYPAQKHAIERVLRRNVRVVTASERVDMTYDWVLFSTVHTLADAKPLPYDQYSTLLLPSVAWAKERLLILGDAHIWQPATHSNLGLAAKYLKANAHVVPTRLTPMEGVHEEKADIEWAAFKSRMSEYVQQAKSHLTIFASEIDTHVIEQLNLTQSLYKASQRNVTIQLVTSERMADSLIEDTRLKAWIKAGVTIRYLPNLYLSGIAVDKNLFTETAQSPLQKTERHTILTSLGQQPEWYSKVYYPVVRLSALKRVKKRRTLPELTD